MVIDGVHTSSDSVDFSSRYYLAGITSNAHMGGFAMKNEVLAYRFQQDLRRLMTNYTDASLPFATQAKHLDFELGVVRQHLLDADAIRNDAFYELDQPYEPRNYDNLQRSERDGRGSPMTPLEALMILREYKDMPYKNKAAEQVCYRASKILTEEATRLMQEQTGGLCTTCWGDGFHRMSDSILSGPCQACGGSGRRAPSEEAVKP